MDIENLQNNNNDYLKENVNPVMFKLIKNILNDKPTNYIDYMIDWFKDNKTKNNNIKQNKNNFKFHNFLSLINKSSLDNIEKNDTNHDNDKDGYKFVKVGNYNFNIPKIEKLDKDLFKKIDLKKNIDNDEIEKINPMSILEEFEKNTNLNNSIAGKTTKERIKNEENLEKNENNKNKKINKKIKNSKDNIEKISNVDSEKKIFKKKSFKIKKRNSKINENSENNLIKGSEKNLYDEIKDNYVNENNSSNKKIKISNKNIKKINKKVDSNNYSKKSDKIISSGKRSNLNENKDSLYSSNNLSNKKSSIITSKKKDSIEENFDNNNKEELFIESTEEKNIKNTKSKNEKSITESINESISKTEKSIKESIDEEISESKSKTEKSLTEKSIKESIDEEISESNKKTEKSLTEKSIDEDLSESENKTEKSLTEKSIKESIEEDIESKSKTEESIKESIEEEEKNKTIFRNYYMKGYIIIKLIHLRQIFEIEKNWKLNIEIIYPNQDIKNINVNKEINNNIILNEDINKLLIINKNKNNKIKINLKINGEKKIYSQIELDINDSIKNINKWKINEEFNMYDIENINIKNKIYYMLMFCNKLENSKKTPSIKYNIKNDNANNIVLNGTLIFKIKKFVSWISILLNNSIDYDKNEIQNIYDLINNQNIKPEFKLAYNNINNIFEIKYPNSQMFKSETFKGPVADLNFLFSSKINIKIENIQPLNIYYSIFLKDLKTKLGKTEIEIENLIKKPNEWLINDTFFIKSYFKSNINKDIQENIPNLDFKFFEPFGSIYLQGKFSTSNEDLDNSNIDLKDSFEEEYTNLENFINDNYIFGINIEGVTKLYEENYYNNLTQIEIKFNKTKTLKTNFESGISPIFNTIGFIEFNFNNSNELKFLINNNNLKIDPQILKLNTIFNKDYLKEIEDNSEGFNWTNHQIKFSKDSNKYISINLCLFKIVNFEKIKEFFLEAPSSSLDYNNLIKNNLKYSNKNITGFLKIKIIEIKNLSMFNNSNYENFNLYVKITFGNNNNLKTNEINYSNNKKWDELFLIKINHKKIELNNIYLDIYNKDSKNNIFMGRIELNSKRVFVNLDEISYNGFYDFYEKKENLNKEEKPLSLGKLGFQTIFSENKKFFDKEIEFPYK